MSHIGDLRPGETIMEGVMCGEDFATIQGFLVRGYCQGGYDGTELDLVECLRWLRLNQPDTFKAIIDAASRE